MAVFTIVPDSVLEPGDPIRSVDIIAIKDNPIAIAEGAAGAPRIVTAAITNGAVNATKMTLPTAGDNVLSLLQTSVRSTPAQGYSGNTDTLAGQNPADSVGFRVPLPGVIRVSFENSQGSTFTTANLVRARILRNGTQLIQYSNSSTNGAFILRILDITVVKGDIITIQQHSVFDVTSSFWRNLKVTSLADSIGIS